MEDPWANAWGEPSKSTSTGNNSNSWSSPSVSVIHGDHEDDLATPSWSFEPDMAWKHEESDVIETSVWKKDSNITTPWDPSPVISHETTLDTITTTPSPPPPETPLPSSEQSSRSTTPTRGLDLEEQPPPIVPPADPPEPPPLVTPLPPSLSIVTDDGDGFGTFETADESVGDPETANWSPSPHNLPLTSADSTSWGGAWADVPSSPRDNQEEEGDDEWETAKRQKERLDRHVPPELLASILQQLESLSDDLWPLPNNEGTLDDTRNFDNEHLGLDAAMQRLVPADLSLPLPTPFDRTFISKQLSGALKLTRHTPLTRRGPMAMFMASKGSTTWEASIKAKPIVTQEDTAPAGWKIVDNTPEVPVAIDSKKKVTGGLMSFFGRRGTTSSVETPVSQRSASPVSIKASSSPRQSADNARPSTPHANHKSSSSISSASAPPPPAAPSNPPEQLYGSTVVTSPIFEESTAAPAPAPSAVSRFFGRFSSHSSRRNSKDSIALSADDLEFLSDVPTANDGDKGPELDALSMMIKSPPLPTALPPPLPPPPKTTMVPARTSFVNTAKPKMPEDDVFDLFGDFEDRMSPGPAPPLMGPPVPPVKSVPLNSNRPSSVSPPPSTVDKVVQQESAWPAFDYPTMPAAKAPVASKKPIVAIMSSSNLSSTAAIPHLHFPKPPQPSLLSNGSNQIPFLPPPPSFSRSHTPLPTQAPATTVIKEEDEDDFADFLSSPPPNSSHQKQAFGSFAGVSSASGVNLTSGNQDLFANFDDDFGIFTSSSPPAPTPPAKSTSPPFQAAPRSGTPSSTSSPSPPSGSGLTRKISRKADHSRTLSLLETAAARGNWLGPPSPLPEALNPPPASSSSADQTFGRNRASGEGKAPGLVTSNVPSSNSMPAVFSSNGFGQNRFNGTSLTSSAPRVAPLPPAANNNPISMPATQIKQPDWFSQAPLQAKPAATNTPSAQVGGLSAQDLSFFEGL